MACDLILPIGTNVAFLVYGVMHSARKLVVCVLCNGAKVVAITLTNAKLAQFEGWHPHHSGFEKTEIHDCGCLLNFYKNKY